MITTSAPARRQACGASACISREPALVVGEQRPAQSEQGAVEVGVDAAQGQGGATVAEWPRSPPSLLAERWAIPLDPARRDGRIVAQSVEPKGSAEHAAIPALAEPALARSAARRWDRRGSTRTSAGLRAAARTRTWSITSGTASGKSLAFNLPVLDGIAARRRSAARSTSTRPRRWPRTRRGSSPSWPAEPARRDLRRRHAAGGAPGDPPALQPRAHQPRHAPRRDPAPPPAAGATSSPTSAGSSSTRRTPIAASSARTSPTCCAGCAASPRAYGAEPRFLLASATIANPRRARRAARRQPSRWSTTTAPRAPGARSGCGTRR